MTPQLAKAFEVKTSRVYNLPVVYFAHLIDFCSKKGYVFIVMLTCIGNSLLLPVLQVYVTEVVIRITHSKSFPDEGTCKLPKR